MPDTMTPNPPKTGLHVHPDGSCFNVRRASGLTLSAANINRVPRQALTGRVSLLHLLAWVDGQDGPEPFGATATVPAALRLMADFISADTDEAALHLLRHASRRKDRIWPEARA